MTDGEYLSAGASCWYDYNARCVNRRNAAINVVVCRAVSQQAAAADGHQPFVSHFSRTYPVINTSVRLNLTTTLVFDELVVKGKQTHQCLCHHMLCCDADIVKFK